MLALSFSMLMFVFSSKLCCALQSSYGCGGFLFVKWVDTVTSIKSHLLRVAADPLLANSVLFASHYDRL